MTAQDRFETLYNENAAVVVAYTRRRASANDADDIVAEVFLTAWRRLEDIPANAQVWLLGVARRVLANKRRSQGRQAALQTLLTDETRHAAAELAGADASSERIGRALRSLSNADREALLLVAWEELSNKDAAGVLGIRTPTFAVRLHRARRNLSRALAAEVPTTPPPTESGMTMEAR
jgi:RNA polymerase sigma-70 factor, ECF subfamily